MSSLTDEFNSIGNTTIKEGGGGLSFENQEGTLAKCCLWKAHLKTTKEHLSSWLK